MTLIGRKIYHDSYAIELYFGEKRSGKTLSMVAKTYWNIKDISEIKVIANLHLNQDKFPNTEYISNIGFLELVKAIYKEKIQLKNTVFLIDEIHTVCDSRRFMGKNNIIFSHFMGQIGKRGNIIRGTTHFPHLVDYRLRQYVERILTTKKGLVNRNNIWEELPNYNTGLTPEENEKLHIKINSYIRKIKFFEVRTFIEDEYYIKANKYFDYYDTEELIA